MNLLGIAVGFVVHVAGVNVDQGVEILSVPGDEKGSVSLAGTFNCTVFETGVEEFFTFTESRYTDTLEFPDGSTSFVTGSYTTDTSVTPNRIVFMVETQDGVPVNQSLNRIFELEGDTLRFGFNADNVTYPASFEEADFTGECTRTGTRSICETSTSEFLSELAMFRQMAEIGDDFDDDGVPDDFVVELIRFVSCPSGAKVPNRTAISEATESAFLVNLNSLEGVAPEVARVTAALALAGETTRDQVITALANAGITVQGALQFVTCNDTDCRADAQFVNALFNGDADLDGDGLTNRDEFEQSNGDLNGFLNSATDGIPGFNGGCASGSGPAAPLWMNSVWDALLVLVVLVALFVRRLNVRET